MHSTLISPRNVSYCYHPIPKQSLLCPSTDSRLVVPLRFSIDSSLSVAASNSCRKGQEKKKKNTAKPSSPPHRSQLHFEQIYPSADQNHKDHHHHHEDKFVTRSDTQTTAVVLAHMWWTQLKAAVGQRLNVEGIVSSVGVVIRDRQLAIPHVMVPDIRYIDWVELKRKGFQGVVFDKDNTITVPYSLTLLPSLASSMEQCKSEFGNDIAVLSNSAGLHEYDPNGQKAKALESAIGIKVIKHRVKKPAGTADEIERHFGCKSSRLVMVGDRPFTDVVYGNRNGFLTILTKPLSLTEEPFIVKQVRKLEVGLVNRWSSKGVMPFSHELFPNAQLCVKDLPDP